MPADQTEAIVNAIRARDGARVLVGIAGPPGSGKSTFAATLAAGLGPTAAVLPMDGFHLDNSILQERGLFDRKGAPETFDAKGFVRLVSDLRDKARVTYPTFDRQADRVRPDAGEITEATRFVLIEGNYLLLQSPPWRDLAGLFDLTVYLDVDRDLLRERLVQRWRDHGLAEEAAVARAEQNDLRNAETVQTHSRRADFTVKTGGN